MSRELLVLTGQPGHTAMESRRRIIEHAVAHVPGMVGHTCYESQTAIAALVTTAPAGGTVAGVDRDGSGLRLTVATGESGLSAAREGTFCGAEAGHVTVLLRDDGDLVLSTDGVGFLPCFWGRRGNGLAISTHLASLVSLGIPATLDEQALAEYLVMQSPLGARTLLREATLLVAGGRLTWGSGRWTPPSSSCAFAPGDARPSASEVVTSFADIWPQVVGDAFSGSGTTVLGLSGGMDSRTIAEGAVIAGLRPMTYTYGAPPSRETVIAGEVAAALGLPNVRIPVAPDRLLAGAVGALDILDGAHSPAQMYEAWFSDVLRSLGDTVVNGHAGGPLWGEDKAFGLTDAGAVVDQRLRAHASELNAVSRYLTAELAAELPTLLRRGLSDSLDGWEIGDRPELVNFWHVQNWELRWGNMLTNAFRRSGIRIEAPFLDARFLSLASTLTADQRRNGRLYLQVQRELFPRTASIPRGDDGNAPRSLNHVYWTGDTSYLRQLADLTFSHPVSGARRAMQQAAVEGAAVLQRRVGISGPADRIARRRSVFPSDVWLRRPGPYADRLRELLQVGDHPWFSQMAVDGALTEIRSTRPTTAALTLGRVASARAWLSDYERRAQALRSALSG